MRAGHKVKLIKAKDRENVSVSEQDQPREQAKWNDRE